MSGNRDPGMGLWSLAALWVDRPRHPVPPDHQSRSPFSNRCPTRRGAAVSMSPVVRTALRITSSPGHRQL